MKAVKWGMGIFLFTVIVIIGAGYAYLKSSVPDYNGRVTVSGI